MEYTFDNRCSDCKYDKDGKCTHEHAMYCQHCELWTPKAEQALKGDKDINVLCKTEKGGEQG